MRRTVLLAAVAAASAGSLLGAVPAQAADLVGSYSLDTGTFGTGYGVHGTGGDQTGTSVTGYVNTDGSLVTFSSPSGLSLNGSGEATVYGLNDTTISSLDVIFAKAWTDITFAFDTGTNGTFNLLVNGVSLFDGSSLAPTCGLCTLTSTGENQFTLEDLSGTGITSLDFNFVPGVTDAKQFRLDSVAAVPEPATWAMLLIGFGFMGTFLRSQKRQKRMRMNYA